MPNLSQVNFSKAHAQHCCAVHLESEQIPMFFLGQEVNLDLLLCSKSAQNFDTQHADLFLCLI